MGLSTAACTIAGWAGSAVVGELVSTGFTYLRDHVRPADSDAELKRLKEALPQITAIMGIAEALKMKDSNASQWVEQFRKAVEASEDVLDELEYKKLEDIVKGRDEADGSASSSKKRKSCAINDDTLERLKDAVTMLDQVANGVGNLLQAATVLGIYDHSESQQQDGNVLSRETTSFLVERELFGREVEKRKIIDWLKRPTDGRLSSFGIVGVGGLGKTTLVKFAYQEIRRSNHFDKTIWVCVSNNFSVEGTMRKILGELGENDNNNNNNNSLNALQENLEKKLHLKKILLVLDDIWDDEKRSDWDELIVRLSFVKEGSKIIFTTRMKSVADLLERVISTEHESLSLQDLPEQELRLMFQRYAFDGYNRDNHRDLEGIGEEILKMLRGSPLAAKVIGSLLNSRMDHQYWRRVLNHGSIFKLEQAKDVVEVLKLSYYHLPENLQVCFRFCSIFPQDHQFDKEDLIKMWICSGFIRQQSRQEDRPEDIGEDYFNVLLKKSFFEYFGKTWEGERYVMHDLMHELAQNVSYGECCRIERNDRSITIPPTVRHVYVDGCEMERVSHLENLRSLVVKSYSNSFVIPNNLIKKSLRLLKICGWGQSEMPKEISCLTHLRYLSSMGPQNNFDFLASIYKLYHLQVLEIPGHDIAGNKGVNPNETKGIIQMTNLLGLRYMRLPKEIMKTIHKVHKLTSLQELTFFVGQASGQRINELGTLKNLRHLSIKNIENIGDYTEAKSANLLEKNNLMSLSLKWTPERNPIDPEKIIGYLQPPPSLMELTIKNYNGPRSPNWMEQSPPLNLSSLKLFNCPLWKNQLFSWKMTYLKILDIRDCLNLANLPDIPLSLTEFRISRVGLTSLPGLYQNSGNNTPVTLSLKSSLRVVEIENCQNLKSLDGFLQQDNIDFQSIEEIEVRNCMNLVHLPMGGFGKFVLLQKLTIWNCPMLMTVDNQSTLLPMALEYLLSCLKLLPATMVRLTVLKVLKVLKVPDLLPDLPASLRDLEIEDASSLKSLPATMVRLTALENLKICDVDLLENLPDLPASLRELEIGRASSLKSLPATMVRLTALENLDIRGVDLLENLPDLSTSLRELQIDGASSLKSLPATMVRLTALENLQIWDVDLLENLPDLPASLRKLGIGGASSLKSLPATMVRLTALENLQIRGVDLLENLPDLSTSLRELVIGGASSLKSLPATMVRLTALENLQIWDVDLLENLPDLPASLRELGIGGASSLKSLPATMVRLTALENLHIWDVHLLENLPDLPASLRELVIGGASCLKSLPATMVRLTTLENLKLWDVDLLENLPDLPASLRELEIDGASSLKSLPATMVSLTALENLKICNVDLLKNLPGLPASLRELEIYGTSSLKSLPATMVRLTTLQNLKICNAHLLENLLDLPASLRKLEIGGASRLKSLPATMGRLTALKNLKICNAHLLENLLDLPASLRKLEIGGASRLKSLPATMGRLTALKNLKICNAHLLENLLDLPASLRKLEIGGASRLKSLPATMGRLTALKNLKICNAHLLENLLDLPASLRKLEIGGASRLKSLPATMGRLTALKNLKICNAHLLENLLDLPASLRKLEIGGASRLKSLPATMGRLTALKNLKICNAHLLENLPDLPASLRELEIGGASRLKSLPATMVRLTALENLKICNAHLLENLPDLPASLKEKKIEGHGGRFL